MQTAVEFLEEKIKIYLPSIHQKGLENAFEQAKQMEKQQIIDAFTKGADDGYDGIYDSNKEQYYTSTYGSKGSDDIKTNNI